MDPPEDEGRPGKSLSEKLFETRLNLAEAALKRAEMELLIGLFVSSKKTLMLSMTVV